MFGFMVNYLFTPQMAFTVFLYSLALAILIHIVLYFRDNH